MHDIIFKKYFYREAIEELIAERLVYNTIDYAHYKLAESWRVVIHTNQLGSTSAGIVLQFPSNDNISNSIIDNIDVRSSCKINNLLLKGRYTGLCINEARMFIYTICSLLWISYPSNTIVKYAHSSPVVCPLQSHYHLLVVKLGFHMQWQIFNDIFSIYSKISYLFEERPIMYRTVISLKL